VDVPWREPAAAEVDGGPGGGVGRGLMECVHARESRTIRPGPQCGFGALPDQVRQASRRNPPTPATPGKLPFVGMPPTG
jgi:hypothetical protein